MLKQLLRARIVGQPSKPTTQTVGNVPNLREDVYIALVNPKSPHIFPPLIRIPVSFFSVKCQDFIDTGCILGLDFLHAKDFGIEVRTRALSYKYKVEPQSLALLLNPLCNIQVDVENQIRRPDIGEDYRVN